MIAVTERKEKLVPKLRFKEFDKPFEKLYFSDLYKFHPTNSLSRDKLNYEGGEIYNIHYGDIHTKFNSNFDLEKELIPYINLDVDLSKVKEDSYCQVRDIVIADASEDYNDIGKSIEIINLNNSKVLAGLHTFLARPYTNLNTLGFVNYLLRSWSLRKQIMTIAQGTKVLSLSVGRVSSLSLCIPSLPEQEKIATFLTAVDEKLKQLSRKKELLEQYKKGVMQKLFPSEGGQVPELRFKQDNGEDFPEWEEKRLGEVCIVNPKFSKLPSVFNYIDLESVDKGQLTKKNPIDLKEAPSRAQRLLISKDILYQTVRPYQKNNYLFDLEGDYVASTGYAQLRAKGSPSFLYQMIHQQNFVVKVLVRCTGTSYPAINSNDLAKINIEIPSVPEQQKIAPFLSSIDEKITKVGEQITKTQDFKKGLLQKMFV